MLDASSVLLLMILATMLLDYGYSRWREGLVRKGIIRSALSQRAVMAAANGLVIGALLYAFDRSLVTAVSAGLLFAAIWVLIPWLVGKWNSRFAFALRFMLQLAALTMLWLSARGYWVWVWESGQALLSSHNLLVLLAYILMLRPASMLIGAVLTPWLESVNTEGSLKRAGTLIGYLERTLILTFVLLEQWEAIGFLLTAKSILRFNDIKGAEQRSLSEYVLLGTLASFTVSIAAGLAILKLAGK